MADPNAIADIFDAQVQFVPAVAAGRFGFGNPTVVSAFAATASFPGRIKAYSGTVTQKLAALVADGFATTSDAYRQVQAAALQQGPPRTVYVGRKDAADTDWGDAIEAIKTEADEDALSFYAFTAATRDVNEIEAICDYLEGDPDNSVFAFYLAQTDDTNILDDNPGNLARNILAKEYKRVALLWHDPEHSSEYGPAVLQSVTGPFVITNGLTLSLRIDGGATQEFDFDCGAAVLTGSQTETFAVTNGDELILAINNGDTQTVVFDTAAATVLSELEAPFAFTSGLSLSVRVNGDAAQPVTFSGTQAAVTGSQTEAFTITAAWQLDVQVDGGATQEFVFVGSETTAQNLADLVNATATGMVASASAGALRLTSDRYGTSSEIEIMNTSTADLLTEIGLTAGSTTGTGFAAFLDIATAAEVAAEINADTTGCTAAAVGDAVRITSDTVGTDSRIQVTGGAANTLIGFDTNETAGSGDFADASVATAQEIIDVINANVSEIVASISAAAVRLTTKMLGTNAKIDVDASTLATTLGLSTTAVTGTGDFADASEATASEIALKISATLTSASASAAESRVVITSNSEGLAALIEATDGTVLDVLAFADAETGDENEAAGTGVQEDFADCAWMGRCITFDLDAPSGAALWDNHTLKGPSPTGIGAVTLKGDRNLADYRPLLHNTLKVNTYERRGARHETHFGTLLNDQLGAGGFIDIRTTIDWLDARITEGFKAIDDAAANSKTKHPYAASGIDKYDAKLRSVLQAAATNGHTYYDSSPLDLDNPLDTGIFTPTIAMQNQTDINNRLIDGFQARQIVQGGIQRGRVIINLVGPTATQ